MTPEEMKAMLAEAFAILAYYNNHPTGAKTIMRKRKNDWVVKYSKSMQAGSLK